MELCELLTSEDIILNFNPRDKWEGIASLVDHLVRRERIPKAVAPAVLEQVLSRERSMSTGMEHGVAIPHAAVAEMSKVVAALGIIQGEEGLSFDSIDGRPARLIVLLIIPRAQKLLHIRTLADIARVLGMSDVREGLLASKSAEEAWKALAAGDAANMS
jgi:mannitol/fructose-specific phosphotransferase system IIA component (Ntr-type)